MEAKTVARTIRIVPCKVRLVLDSIRGKNAGGAIAILRLTSKVSSPVIEKILVPALANTGYNYDVNTDELVAKGACADEGPTLKRFRPCTQGRAGTVNRRTSHTTIVVSDGKEEAKGT